MRLYIHLKARICWIRGQEGCGNEKAEELARQCSELEMEVEEGVLKVQSICENRHNKRHLEVVTKP